MYLICLWHTFTCSVCLVFFCFEICRGKKIWILQNIIYIIRWIFCVYFFLILLFNICYSNSQILKYHWFCNEVKVIKLRKLFQLNCMWVKLFVISTRFIFEMSILCSAKIIIYLLREKKNVWMIVLWGKNRHL